METQAASRRVALEQLAASESVGSSFVTKMS